MGHYELISACFFFGKLALKKHFFEVHTSKFADPLPPLFTLVKFFTFFLVASLNLYTFEMKSKWLCKWLEGTLPSNHYHVFC